MLSPSAEPLVSVSQRIIGVTPLFPTSVADLAFPLSVWGAIDSTRSVSLA